MLRRLHENSDAGAASRLIGAALPPLVASLLQPHEFESLRHRLIEVPESIRRVRLAKEDWIGALGVFLLVFLSMFPVVVPFIFISNGWMALRISNGIAVILLFLAGYSFGRFADTHPWLTGLVMTVIGIAIVGLAMLLGG